MFHTVPLDLYGKIHIRQYQDTEVWNLADTRNRTGGTTGGITADRKRSTGTGRDGSAGSAGSLKRVSGSGDRMSGRPTVSGGQRTNSVTMGIRKTGTIPSGTQRTGTGSSGIGGTSRNGAASAGSYRSGTSSVNDLRRNRGASTDSGIRVVTETRSTQDTDAKKRQEALDRAARVELRKREKRRKLIILLCALAAVLSLGYFGLYQYYGYRTDASSEDWARIREEARTQSTSAASSEKKKKKDEEVVVHKTGAKEIPDVLEEYEPLLLRNASLIGWITIPDTNIDYPVMQTTNNDYYLDHNFNQEYDKNGCIFMDADCDVIDRSTNLILYGHHMKSGKMFGSLDSYRSQEFYKNHKEFTFDTIYEKGTYAVAYVFRSQIYTEDEITFKYYQFINANSEMEFNSNMQAMAEMSLYETGITPKWGDELITLSTCDQATSSEARFVVVGVKIM